MTIEQFEKWQSRLPSLWALMGPREKWNYIARRQKRVTIKIPKQKSFERVEVDGVVKYKDIRKGRIQKRDRSGRNTGGSNPDTHRKEGELVFREITAKYGIVRSTIKSWINQGTLLSRREGIFSYVMERDVIERINKSVERRRELAAMLNSRRGS